MNTETAQRVLELELPRLRQSELNPDASREAATIQGAHVRVHPPAADARPGRWWTGEHGRLTDRAKKIVLLACAVIAVAAVSAVVVIVLDSKEARGPAVNGGRSPRASLSETSANDSARVAKGVTAATRAHSGTLSVGAAKPSSQLRAAGESQSIHGKSVTNAAVPDQPGVQESATVARKASSRLPASGLEEVSRGQPRAEQQAERAREDAIPASSPASSGLDFSRPMAPLSE